MTNSKYTLTRLNDGLIKTADRISYIEWNEDRTAKSMHDDIAIGRSIVLRPGFSYTWLTTQIEQIIEQREDYIKFKTTNSTYELIIK